VEYFLGREISLNASRNKKQETTNTEHQFELTMSFTQILVKNAGDGEVNTFDWLGLTTEQEKILEKDFPRVMNKIRLIKQQEEPCVRCELAKKTAEEKPEVWLENWLRYAPLVYSGSVIDIKNGILNCAGLLYAEAGLFNEENTRFLNDTEVKQIAESIPKLPTRENLPECTVSFVGDKIQSVKGKSLHYEHADRIKSIADLYGIKDFNTESFGGITPAHINHDIDTSQPIIVCKFVGKKGKHFESCSKECYEEHEPNWTIVDGIHRFYRCIQDNLPIRAFVVSVDNSMMPRLEVFNDPKLLSVQYIQYGSYRIEATFTGNQFPTNEDLFERLKGNPVRVPDDTTEPSYSFCFDLKVNCKQQISQKIPLPHPLSSVVQKRKVCEDSDEEQDNKKRKVVQE